MTPLSFFWEDKNCPQRGGSCNSNKSHRQARPLNLIPLMPLIYATKMVYVKRNHDAAVLKAFWGLNVWTASYVRVENMEMHPFW